MPSWAPSSWPEKQAKTPGYTRVPGPLAQLVEQGTLNPKVVGSIPTRPIAGRTARLGTIARMNGPVGIVGAGYVGLPLAQVFADAGRQVLLVEVDEDRVEAI